MILCEIKTVLVLATCALKRSFRIRIRPDTSLVPRPSLGMRLLRKVLQDEWAGLRYRVQFPREFHT